MGTLHGFIKSAISNRYFPPLQKLLHLLNVHGVEDISWFEPSFPCDSHSETDICQSLLLMGIRIDGNFHPPFLGIFAQPPINVQPEGMGIELNGHSRFTRFIDQTNHVDLIRFPSQEEATGWVWRAISWRTPLTALLSILISDIKEF